MTKALERARLLAGRATLGTLMERLARVHGDARLVEQAGDRPLELGYRQAARRVARWAGGIASQVQPGDRVVIATPNGYQMLLLSIAASRAGAIAVPVNAKMRDEEVRAVVADSEAALVLRSPAEVDRAEPLTESRPAAPGDVAAIFYTSGTTGSPKGARLTHRALVGQLGASALWPSRLRRDEAVVALPVAHIMGFIVLLGMATAGVPVYLLPRFRPGDVLDAIEQRRATMFVGVPAMYRMMLEAGAAERDLSSVRVWMSGADTMPADLARRFKRMGGTAHLPLVGRTVGEAAFVEGYGMVEVGGGAAAKVSPPFLATGLGDAVGFALPRYRFKVVDDEGREVMPGLVGELLVKGPGLLESYHGDPEATRAAVTDDGWLRTGDLARRGPVGLVAFAGRKKDVIKHGGYSVFAAEVERALEEHPEVLEAAVVGLRDARKGETVAAAVRIAPGATLTGERLASWARQRLADYKVPERVVVVDELPRTGTDKVQKSRLRDLFDERPPAPAADAGS